MKKRIITGTVAILTWGGLVAGSAIASLMIDHGTEILLVDGTDSGSTINLFSFGVSSPGYDLKYSLNGVWDDFDMFLSDIPGEGILDFALVGQTPDEFYILSNDVNDSNFSATMLFLGDIAPSEAQQPLMTTTYYDSVTVAWSIGGGMSAFTTSFALPSGSLLSGYDDWSDGVAPVLVSTPVPEPGTMVILGTCLLCLGGAASRKKKKK